MAKSLLKYEKDHGGREKYVRTDRQKDMARDCVIRAIAIATEQDYKKVMTDLCRIAVEQCNMPNNRNVYEEYLLNELGWVKHKPYKNSKGKTVEVREFPAEEGKNYIIHTTSHLTAIKDRVVRDTWWCGEYRANSYYTKD